MSRSNVSDRLRYKLVFLWFLRLERLDLGSAAEPAAGLHLSSGTDFMLQEFWGRRTLEGPEAAEPTQTITVPPPCLAPQDHRGATGLSVIGSSKTLW